MKIVTSGSGYADIDAYAGTVAYAELLQAQGIGVVAAGAVQSNCCVMFAAAQCAIYERSREWQVF